MTQKKTTFFLCLLIPALIFSLAQKATAQGTASIEVRKGDTVAVVPIADIRKANLRTIQLNECREENDSINSAMRTCQGVTNNLRATIADLKSANNNASLLVVDKQKIIDLSDITIKKQARRIRLLKVERAGLGAVAAVLALKIFIGK